jgi:hypothetical protein
MTKEEYKATKQYTFTIVFHYPSNECGEGFVYNVNHLVKSRFFTDDGLINFLPIPISSQRSKLVQHKKDIVIVNKRMILYPLTNEEWVMICAQIRDQPVLCTEINRCRPLHKSESDSLALSDYKRTILSFDKTSDHRFVSFEERWKLGEGSPHSYVNLKAILDKPIALKRHCNEQDWEKKKEEIRNLCREELEMMQLIDYPNVQASLDTRCKEVLEENRYNPDAYEDHELVKMIMTSVLVEFINEKKKEEVPVENQ